LFSSHETATTSVSTLSLHDALPISRAEAAGYRRCRKARARCTRLPLHGAAAPSRAAPACRRRGCCGPPAHGSRCDAGAAAAQRRSEEHTSELQSLAYLVCRLLLEKK